MTNNLLDRTLDFATEVVKFTETVNRHYSLVNQLERSATGIGANVREANYAQSRADFISKMQIALKECYETEYWLELFARIELIDSSTYMYFMDVCRRIRRTLIASICTAKKNGEAR